jgi:hypothetical protein
MGKVLWLGVLLALGSQNEPASGFAIPTFTAWDFTGRRPAEPPAER